MITLRCVLSAIAMILIGGCASSPIPMVVPPSSPQGVTVDQSTDTREIFKAADAWLEAYNSREPMRLAAVYDPVAVLWDLGSAKVVANIAGTGGAAIAQHFTEEMRRHPTARIKFDGGHIRRNGDVGVTAGIYILTETIDGMQVSKSVRHTLVYRKRDGIWVVYADHSSPLP